MAIVKVKETFNCDIKKVWDIVTNNNNYSWRSDIEKIDIIDDLTFIEYDKKSNIKTTFKITKIKPYSIYEFDMENENIRGHWSGKFEGDENKVSVEFTEDVTAKKAIMKLFVKSYLKMQQSNYIHDLGSAIMSK